MPSIEEVTKSFEPRSSLKEICDLRRQLIGQPSAVKREFNTVLDTYEEIISSQTWDIAPFSKLPIRFIHGDYHMQNLLMKGNEIVTVLDWEKCGWSFRGKEIMRSIIHNCRKTASELSWPLIETYLRAYRQHATLSPVEASLTFECGYRPVVFGFWAIKQYLLGHKHFRQNILRRKQILQVCTDHRVEYAERIAQLLMAE